jgi:cellulose synthase/poly-beta-1,6-N-acetylglucosamine synthase-like glycosyltransferase
MKTINEDIQYSMLLAQRGWERLYVENAAILTGGPSTLRTYLGQRVCYPVDIYANLS